MNRPVRKVALACMILFAALMINANWIQVVDASNLKDKPQNGRRITQRLERQRGQIVATGGQVLAVSKPFNDQYKFLRSYPSPTAALYADITGYYALFSATGLEKSQDSVLSGDDDRLFASRLSDLVTGRQQRGGTVVTTIRPAIQQVASDALAGRKGAVVALNPQTGAILAIVSNPGFDPNSLASHNSTNVTAAAKALNTDPNQPLLNRATQQTYPPGSTFKLITAAAALKAGRTPDTLIDSPTVLPLPQSNIPLTNFGGESCGNGKQDTLADALRISCNTAFGKLGMDLGASALQAQAEAFGLNATVPGFPLIQATSVFPSGLNQPQTAQSAIGQFDVRVSPLQMAEVVAAIGNGGRLMKPFLVSQLLGADLKSISTTSPQKLAQPVTADVAAQLTQMMEGVVQNGTGTAAQIPGVAVAGKTGTAEHGAGLAPHAWFVGFAPAQNPTVAVSVIVEDGGGELQATGGAVAAPIAKAVMQAVLEGK